MADIIDDVIDQMEIEDDPDASLIDRSVWTEDDDGQMTPLQHETTLIESGMVDIKNSFIDNVTRQFNMRIDSTRRAFLRNQLASEGDTWYYNTELNGQDVRLRLTGRGGKLLARSSIQNAKGGRDFFHTFDERELRPTGAPLVLQQDIEAVIEDPTNALLPEDRRELGGLATTLASTASKVKAAGVNVDWANKELKKAQGELAHARQGGDEDQITYWEGEVERFDTQKILYERAQQELEQTKVSQLSRIKMILRNLADDSRPLGERIKELFEQEGVTIVSIIGAVVLTISTIALGIANAAKSVVAPAAGGGSGSGGDKPTLKDRVREILKKLAGYLKELAKKGAAALPGLIGSVVSFILRKAGEVVGYVAEHLIILLVLIVTLIFEYIRKRF